MTAVGWRLAALALLLGLALGGRGAWLWQANDYGQQLSEQAGKFAQERDAASAVALERLQQEQVARQVLEVKLKANDQTYYRELQDVQNTQARLRDRLATADLRLSVLLSGPDPAACGGGGLSAAAGAGGVVHGGARGELDPAAARRIVAIAGDGDAGLTALRACQGYVRELVNAGGGP